MYESGMRFFEVQYRRHGEDMGIISLHAWDEADAIARAEVCYRKLAESGWRIDNPLGQSEGLKVRVGLIVEPGDPTLTVFGEWKLV
jgi:hypothetical protein